MSTSTPADGAGGTDGAARIDPVDGADQARRRAADIGALLPERSSDETASGWHEHDEQPDEEYLRNVPPHHG